MLVLAAIDITDGRFGAGRERSSLGACRVDADHTSGRVLAVQRALRTAQHLDAIEIEQIARAEDRTRTERAVDEQAHGRFERRNVAEIADAAHTEVRHDRADARLHFEYGDLARDVVDVLHAGIAQGLALNADTAIGTSCSDCSRFWAVTTISSRPIDS